MVNGQLSTLISWFLGDDVSNFFPMMWSTLVTTTCSVWAMDRIMSICRLTPPQLMILNTGNVHKPDVVTWYLICFFFLTVSLSLSQCMYTDWIIYIVFKNKTRVRPEAILGGLDHWDWPPGWIMLLLLLTGARLVAYQEDVWRFWAEILCTKRTVFTTQLLCGTSRGAIEHLNNYCIKLIPKQQQSKQIRY